MSERNQVIDDLIQRWRSLLKPDEPTNAGEVSRWLHDQKLAEPKPGELWQADNGRTFFRTANGWVVPSGSVINSDAVFPTKKIYPPPEVTP